MGSSGWKAFNVPLLPLTLALILGICVGEYIPAAVSLISLVITVILLLFVRNHHKKIAKLLALASLIAVGAVLIHLRLHPSIAPHHIAKVPDRTRVMLAGTIYRPPQRQGERTVICLRTDSIYRGDTFVPATGKVRITIGDPTLSLRYGHRVSVKAKLYRPRNFGNPGAFDYERYLRRQGVLVTGYVRAGEPIEILETGGNPLLRWFDHWREAIATFLDEHTLPPGRGLLKALLIGERGEIPKEVKDNFIDAGAAHILAISGLHLGIIVTLVFFSIRQVLKLSERILLRFNIRKVAALATFPFLFCYILITGLPISTIRAGIMASAFLGAILLDRYRNPLNAVAIAAFLILLISPTSLWDPSFQLSFSAVLGIILLAPPLHRRLFPQDPLTSLTPRKGAKLRMAVALSLIASFAALLVTLPLVAFHFHRLSTVGLISNAIIIPLVGLGILPLGLLCLVFIPIFPQLGALLAKVAAELSRWGIIAMELISSLPFSSWYVPSPTTLEMVLFYSVIASLLWLTKSYFRKAVLGIILLLVMFDLSYWGLKDYAARGVRVTFLDVGQGDCALVEFPRGRRMLIDGGGLYGDFDVGERVIAPFLWERRILEVDYLVLTHQQPDHFKGFIFIAQHFRVREFWHNAIVTAGPAHQQLLQVIGEKGIRVVKTQEGFLRSIGEAWVEILHPPEGLMRVGSRKRAWVNNNSLVVKISFGDHSLLFAGDIEKEAEARLLREGKRLRAQLIKVPHHGSKTSSTYYFVKEVSPLYAIISLGFRNPYRLPNQRVVQRYKARGCQVLRTDRDGAIMVKSDGKRLEVRTYRTSKKSCAAGSAPR